MHLLLDNLKNQKQTYLMSIQDHIKIQKHINLGQKQTIFSGKIRGPKLGILKTLESKRNNFRLEKNLTRAI